MNNFCIVVASYVMGRRFEVCDTPCRTGGDVITCCRSHRFRDGDCRSHGRRDAFCFI